MDSSLHSLDQVKALALDMGIRFGPKMLVAIVIIVIGYIVGRGVGRGVGRYAVIGVDRDQPSSCNRSHTEVVVKAL